MAVTMADITHLRKMTGAGMMDCKSALTEANGDFDKAVEIIRKKGQAVAAKREDRDAAEGCTLSATKGNFAAIVAVKCETDFVAKGEAFIGMVKSILNVALDKQPKTAAELSALKVEGRTVQELITDRIGVTGEKMELGAYEFLTAPTTVAYVHPGNKLATIAGLNQAGVDNQVARDIAMQVAAMNPVSVDKASVPAEIVAKEKNIAREKAIEQGKPEAILDKIAEGALQKYFKENTLLAQEFVKDNKLSIDEYLKKQNKDLTVTAFKRVNLNQE
ncbi:translation elongation factor Ts [Candidatus Symbiothrix dinenymphae]|uniref:translation elongation factor Ts n=1 Tax=Candidatus Symbiothrix dinenymphae TaxID=467085 RepID=UPI0007037840|nr:translation elongation factor Ts [Candidatus Symbiothrix dinenymphae]